MEIKIGTSGYSFDDWVGSFYPPETQKGKRLDYYVRFFPAVEINSTYYRIPHPAIMANIDKKAPPGFEFIVKTPEILTHKRKNIEKLIAEFNESIRPMVDSDRLKGLLAQFPFSFKFSQGNLEYVRYCQEQLKPHQLFVEFRHNSWVNRTVYDDFLAHAIGYVAVDEPQLPGLLRPDCFNTTETAYIRLHGRNAEHWWNGGPLRYDYDYSADEIREWKEKVKKLEGKAKKVFIFFNNCHLGQAVKNARQMMEMLNI